MRNLELELEKKGNLTEALKWFIQAYNSGKDVYDRDHFKTITFCLINNLEKLSNYVEAVKWNTIFYQDFCNSENSYDKEIAKDSAKSLFRQGGRLL